MSVYVQYHNFDERGLLIGDKEELAVLTRRPHARQAMGGRVFVIFGIGSPRHFYLWDSFQVAGIEECADGSGQMSYRAYGPGHHLRPPRRLDGSRFEAFRKSCANLVSFRRIDDLPYSRTLQRFAQRHQHPDCCGSQAFLAEVSRWLDADQLNHLKHHLFRHMRALSVRQPHAEAIIRKQKEYEKRSFGTRIRGQVFIYASRQPAGDQANWLRKYGISSQEAKQLPRGFLIGTVDLHDCNRGKWYLRRPVRLAEPLKPLKPGQPVCFRPF